MGLSLARQGVILHRVADDEGLRRLLEASAAQGFVQAREDYLGASVFALQDGQTFSVLPGFLVQSANEDAARAAVRRHGKDLKGIAGTDAFRTAVAGLPERRLLLVYSDPHAPGATSLLFASLDEQRRRVPAMSILPPNDFFKGYQAPSAFVVGADDAGIRLSFRFGMRLPPGEEEEPKDD
jgi:hypothetical protein